MAIEVTYKEESKGLEIEKTYLKLNQVVINKPNGIIELVGEGAIYLSKEDKDNGKEPISDVDPLSLGKIACDDGSLSSGDKELPTKVKAAVNTIFGYAYGEFKDSRYSGALDV